VLDQPAPPRDDLWPTKIISVSKFQPKDPIALGDAPSGPIKEDKRHRSVTLNLKFSITIEDLYLFTENHSQGSRDRASYLVK
jgi:hypothetical protein